MKKKIIIGLFSLLVLITAIICIVGAISSYNYDIKHLEEEQTPVDMIIVGASQVYHGCNPEVISEQISHSESPAEITLYMAYPKSDKLELIIQKSIELGAARIVPFESSRCIKRPKAEKIEKQTARLQRIAEEAAKQCGRARLPIVREPISFKKVLEEAATAELSLFCYEGRGTRSLKEVLGTDTAPSSISVIVGSEGGFSPEEAEAAAAAKLTPVNLGPRILRCETAPMYALSAISYQLEH